MKKWALGIVILCGAILSTKMFLSPSSQGISQTLNVVADLDSLTSVDPAETFEFSGMEVIANTYMRLLTMPSLDVKSFKNGIAAQGTFSDDGRFLTFILKPNLKFASGNPVRAQDVAFSFVRLAVMGKMPAQILEGLGWNAGNVRSKIKVESDNCLVLEIDPRLPQDRMLSIFTALSLSIVDEKTALHHSPDDYGAGWLRQHTAGSGPFTVKRWLPQQALILEANPFYAPAPLMKQIVFRFVKEVGAQELLLRKGDADLAYNVIIPLPGSHLETAPSPNLKILHLNQKYAPLAHPKVREAIRYLIDYEGIANNIKPGLYAVHNSFILSCVPIALKGLQFKRDVAKAKALLKEAGFEKGLTVSLSAVDPDCAQKLKHDLEEGGITVDILLGDSKQVLTRLRAREHEMAISTTGLDPLGINLGEHTFLYNPDDRDLSEHKTFAWRNHWIVGKTLNERVSTAKFIRDPKTRAQVYQHLQEIFLKDAPLIVLAQENKVVAVRDNVKNVVYDQTSGTFAYERAEKT